ncbi:hypothetical protein ZWY2020_018589 [Hordeum vulgare]|nr:hypothetical protein ZWY2020_018589 [Hordeum vulgare]
MDSKEKKPHLLHVSATVAQKTTAARPAAVALISTWALFTAFGFVLNNGIISLYSLLTDGLTAEVSALHVGRLCCAELQVAAAVLALRLPCRRVWARYAFAYLALALTTVGHCMFTAQVRLLIIADPGDDFFRILCGVAIFMYAVADIVGFLVLLLVEGEEE